MGNRVGEIYIMLAIKQSGFFIFLFFFTPVLHHCVGACGLEDHCWVHKQKVVGSSPITVNVLCP